MKSLKLNQIEKNVLSTKEMNQVNGGGGIYCRCGCYYRNTTGSSLNANGGANWRGGLASPDLTRDQLLYLRDGTEFFGRHM